MMPSLETLEPIPTGLVVWTGFEFDCRKPRFWAWFSACFPGILPARARARRPPPNQSPVWGSQVLIILLLSPSVSPPPWSQGFRFCRYKPLPHPQSKLGVLPAHRVGIARWAKLWMYAWNSSKEYWCIVGERHPFVWMFGHLLPPTPPSSLPRSRECCPVRVGDHLMMTVYEARRTWVQAYITHMMCSCACRWVRRILVELISLFVCLFIWPTTVLLWTSNEHSCSVCS